MKKLFLLLMLALPAFCQPRIRYVIFHKPGPNWQVGVGVHDQKGVQEHIHYFTEMNKQGRLYAGGPFMDSASGGMMIIRLGETPESVQSLAQADPAVQSGLLLFEIRPWILGMEGEPSKP